MTDPLKPGAHGLPPLFARRLLISLLALLLACSVGYAQIGVNRPNPETVWTEQVEPMLDRHCLKCHAGVRQRGGLDLRSIETIVRGGDSGPAMLPGRPAESRMLQYASPHAPLQMPPEPLKTLSPQELTVLKRWIAMLPPVVPAGAKMPPPAAWTPTYAERYRRTLPVNPPPPGHLDASASIDWMLRADWRREGVIPAPLCSDAAFARRVNLDLAGQIPTREEMRSFLADRQPDRRTRLVDRLLASDAYSVRMREVFDALLMGRVNRGLSRQREASGWYAYLESSFRANRPWDAMVRDMLLARGTDPTTRGCQWFLAERKDNYQSIAEAVAPMVFGVQIKCAQCHNHPLAWEIEQRHYWGLVAAFNRSKNVETASGLAVAESAVGGFIKFANLKKESQPATIVLLNGKTVAERIPGPDEKEMDAPSLYLIPPARDGEKPQSAALPRVSRREEFAEAATHDNPMLARAFVNRIWCCLMGRGIVHPADQIDSRHHASHPELLDWLSRDFAKSGYNVKRLVREIVLARAYQLDAQTMGAHPPRPETFARSLEKPLTAEQYVRSLRIATGAPLDEVSQRRLLAVFAERFPDVMPETYNASLQQALFLTNSATVDDLMKPAPGTTAAKLAALRGDVARVKEAFWSVLGRAPDAAEIKSCSAVIRGRPAEAGVRDLLWALLTCAEFQVNH